ncbi:CinA family protein [Nocardia sp. NPDC049220]|uniref:CinA family protein n=1 Tax=Nocardia sp. NPDC049220 TaxID=3155273 RepID=UPI0033F86838
MSSADEQAWSLLDSVVAVAVTRAGGPDPQDGEPAGSVWFAVATEADVRAWRGARPRFRLPSRGHSPCGNIANADHGLRRGKRAILEGEPVCHLERSIRPRTLSTS